MKVLIDTCVVIDLLQNRVPFSDDAKKIFYLIGDKKINGCITANSCTDIYYITRKALHDTEAAKDVMKKLFKLVTILDGVLFTLDAATGKCLRAERVDQWD